LLDLTDLRQAIAWLRSTAAVRRRCNEILSLAEDGALANFTVCLRRMEAAAQYVADVTRRNYPDLNIPYHARWRHFAMGGRNRWAELASTLRDEQPAEIARIRFDLVVVSVLLDAGAGPKWRYTEPDTGLTLSRSEGLAIASLHAFCAGLFSSDQARKLQADSIGLERIDESALARALQVHPGNELAGLAGRTLLMRNLGTALKRHPELFGRCEPRIGHLFDHFRALAAGGPLRAHDILRTILVAFASIWPGRIFLDGENLGDVWRYEAIISGGLTAGLVPFHKLAQWLTYSLVEVLEDAGIAVAGMDEMTGLAEYRNGGLFLDFGVLQLRNERLASDPLPVDHEAVVEWRALTIALLDRIAEPIRRCLGCKAAEMPLARILEGGTWAAARIIARERRRDGAPPLRVISDGTVF
jgi:Protein of unknown function (DUF1688)